MTGTLTIADQFRKLILDYTDNAPRAKVSAMTDATASALAGMLDAGTLLMLIADLGRDLNSLGGEGCEGDKGR